MSLVRAGGCTCRSLFNAGCGASLTKAGGCSSLWSERESVGLYSKEEVVCP